MPISASDAEKLSEKAAAIRYNHKPGLHVPIQWHLALRGVDEAMIELAHWISAECDKDTYGVASDAFSPAGLYRRAFRRGNARAAQHLAMTCFNRGDLAGYRYWLARGAQLGDPDAAAQRKAFEIRLPHAAASKIRRGRPWHKRDLNYF